MPTQLPSGTLEAWEKFLASNIGQRALEWSKEEANQKSALWAAFYSGYLANENSISR